MAQPFEISTQGVNKTEIDLSLPGSMIISADDSARFKPAAFVEPLESILKKLKNEHALVLNPLRLILLTAELGNAVTRWQRALGVPEAGVSQQPEGLAVAKSMSWGTDEQTARSIIILADYIANGIGANNPIAVSTLAHELGHVHAGSLP